MSLLLKKYPDFKVNSITININQEYKPHYHQRQSKSMIMLLGGFEGGALCVEDGTRISEQNRFFEFDGGLKHWVEPWTGNRISVVYYYKKPPSEYQSK